MMHAARRRAYSWSLTCAGLALVLSWVTACGGGGSKNPMTPPPPTPQTGNTVVVQVFDNSFEPKSVSINPNDTVRWVMAGSAAGHTVTDESGVFDSGFAFSRTGDIFEHKFTSADDGTTFQYRCSSHYLCCRMQGSVRVGASAPPPGPGY